MIQTYEHLYRLYSNLGADDVQTKIFYSGLLALLKSMINEIYSLKCQVKDLS